MCKEKLQSLWDGLTQNFRDDEGRLEVPALIYRQLVGADIINVTNPAWRYDWRHWEPERLKFIDLGNELKSVTRLALEWVRDMDPNAPSSIWFCGSTGVGKDHLAHICAVALALRNNWTVRKIDWVVAMQEIKGSFSNGRQVDSALTKEKETDVLIWSDIDRPNTSLFVAEKVGELLRRREHKCTIYTSNASLKDYCTRILRNSKIREEQPLPGEENPTHLALQSTADTIQSRLRGTIFFELPFISLKGDWRQANG